jgi:cytoskeleton protein RodZ
MASLGTQLKLAREKRGATLEDVSTTTKIGTRMLRAIEEDQYDQLPGGIFNKGFVRAFAKAVGVDEEKAVADYLAATEPPEPVADQDSEMLNRVAELRAEAEPRDTGLSWGLLAVLLVIAALGFAAWGYYTRESRKTENPTPNASTQPPIASSVSTTPSPAPAEQTPTPAATKETPQSNTAQPKPPAPDAPNKTAATPVQTQTTTSAAPETANAEGYFSVHIKVRGDSWLSVSSDGKTVLQGTIAAPAFKAVRARNQIVVKAGNVGALDFEFNGERLPSQGSDGEVKTLTFGTDGLEAIQTSSPQPSQP